jgi:TRAP-type C4-dicarboxylate transport system substrate-binding protein
MQPLSIRFGGYQSPVSVHSRAAEVFGEALTRRLGSDVRFVLDGDITAAGHRAADVLSMVESGALTLGYFSASYLAARVPEFALLDLPFMIRVRRQAYAVLDGVFGLLLAEKLQAATGLRVLSWWDNGFRHLSNAIRPLRTPADCQGIRLRILASELHRQVFTRLGFTPVVLDVKDLIAAVKSGSIEAQENPLTNIYNFGFHAYHRFITLSSHFFGAAVLLCHAASYAAWPAEVQQAVTAAAALATTAQRRFAAAEDEAVLSQLAATDNDIVCLTEVERALFVAAVAPLVDEQRRVFGEQLWRYITDTPW